MKCHCILFVLTFIVITFSLQGQTISGRVIDAKTLEPIPFANIFLNNTTIGTTTELNGEFLLKKVRQPAIYEVIFSFVGYESFKMKVSLMGDELKLGTIRLKQAEIELGVVEVKEKKDTQWEKKLKKFKKIFLGEDTAADLCTILNPWVIDFSQEGNKLSAVASEPLEIENKALGYKIHFHLRNFQATNTTYLIEGNVRFEEMTDTDEFEITAWLQNRSTSYRHSRQHLFKSILDQRIKGEGFNLYTEINDLVNTTTRSAFFYSELGSTLKPYDTAGIVSPTAQPGIYKINLKGRVEVHYKKEKILIHVYRDVFNPVSWITLNKGFVLVNKDGVELNAADVVVAGDMNSDRVAHLLPINYVPEETILEEQKLELIPLLEEKIYVHTDKPYYYPGESIWFKGYLNYRAPVLRDSLSETVYVELVDRSKNSVLQSKMYRIENGFFVGDILLPNNFSSGSYYLRAYTNLNRNFGDDRLFVKPIPILNISDKVKLNTTVKEKAQDTLFTISSNKKAFKPREKITLTLQVKEEDDLNSLLSNISLSVTDATQVVPVEISDDIMTLLPFDKKPLGLGKDGLVYPIEHGISFSGRFLNDKKKPEKAMLNIFQINPRNFSMAQSDEKGFFSVSGFSFYDTATFSIQGTGEKWVGYGRAEFVKREVPPMNFDEIKYSLDFVKTESPQRILYTPAVDSKMLQEVEIKASKIQEEYTMEYRIKRPYGKPNYVLKAKEINTSYGNLLLALPGKFPGLVVRLVDNPGPNGANGEGPKWVVYLLRAQTTGSHEVLVTVNDAYVGGDPKDILGSINPQDVESIELKTGVNVLYGASSFGGVLSIYTRQGLSDEPVVAKKNIPTLLVAGYSKATGFNSPDYDNPGANSNLVDYRSLLYWNPMIRTDSSTGRAAVSFFASDLPGRYRVVAEGVMQSGKPIRCVTYVEVEN